MRQQDQSYTNRGSVRSENRNSKLGGKAGYICDVLEHRLARGVYLFGEPISSLHLAQEFKTSRAPVSAALSHLRSAGYLIITPQVGSKVISPTRIEIEDFFRLFGKAEGFMARLAAERHDENEIQLLIDLSKKIHHASPKIDEALSENFLSLLSEFYGLIRSMARSPMIAKRVADQWHMSEFLLFNGQSAKINANIAEANKERDQIVDIISHRDSARAERIMATHVCNKPFRTGTL